MIKVAHCDYFSPNSMCLLFTTITYPSLRFTSSEDSDIPLSINCWPSDNGSGGCDVNIEYELENTELELQVFESAIIGHIYEMALQDVVITIPVPHGVGAPNVAECDGDYTMDSRRSALLWQVISVLTLPSLACAPFLIFYNECLPPASID